MIRVTHYEFGVPPPFGTGGGATFYSYNKDKLTGFQSLSIKSAGVEATAIFGNHIRMNWLNQGNINPRQSSLYFLNQQDITIYTLISKSHGDIVEYINLLNHTYAKGNLELTSLKKRALINYLDPFSWFSTYAWWNYVVSGKKTSIPMISIKSYKYLPSARLGLTPFGPEYYLENFLIKENRPTYFYLRAGSFAGMTFTGVGIESPSLWQLGSFPLGLRLDLWNQPKVDFSDDHYSLSALAKMKFQGVDIKNSRPGLSLSFITQKKLWKEGSLFLQLGGKTRGFVPGESLEPSLIVRCGLTLW